MTTPAARIPTTVSARTAGQPSAPIGAISTAANGG